MRIRKALESDLDALMAVFAAAVHDLAGRAYTREQCRAWAPLPPDPDAWRARLSRLHARLACDGDEVAGFIGYTHQGHVDLLFTAPQHARRGVASALFRAACADLRRAGAERVFAEASLAARPFFERQGLAVLAEEVMLRQGEALRRFRMEGALPSPHVPTTP